VRDQIPEMRIEHLNCGTMCPWGGRLMDGRSPGIGPAHLVCHCLVIETGAGLVLVDTGLGLRDVQAPHERLSGFFRHLLRLKLDPEETAARQLVRRGYRISDVRHIIVTHLDFDHAGGLQDFPGAMVHLMAAEERGAMARHTPIERGRFRPEQWGDRTLWRRYHASGEPWFGFEAVRRLQGLPPEILLIPLVGHTWGHAGIAVQTDTGWLLHAGDAYFHRREVDPVHPHAPPGLRGYQLMMDTDREQRLANQARLRRLVREHHHEVRVFSSHDAGELEDFRAATPSVRLVQSEPGASPPI
jgi:glyoxylase-like metal-dependent hydrolase (beta-lactamase superfamily II)